MSVIPFAHMLPRSSTALLARLLQAMVIAAVCIPLACAQQEQPGLLEALGKLLQPRQESKPQVKSGEARNLAVAGQPSRVALVIGNSAYPGPGALRNPANDANDVGAKLKRLGFDVTIRTDMRHKEMLRSLTEFGDKVQSGTEALFFYAGHGMQVRGKNYLLPVDAEVRSEASVSSEAVDVDQLLDKLSMARLSVVILDACRNNPFERRFRGGGQGLAQINAPTGTLIAYATAPGKVAADGDGRNGLYTAELLAAMDVPGIKIEDVFKRVRSNVVKKSNDAQTPWESSSLTGDFYFTSPAPAAANEPRVLADPEGEAWRMAERTDSVESMEAYLREYPKGNYVAAARVRLAALKRADAASLPPEKAPLAAAPSEDPETQFWNEVKASGAREYFDAYLKQYPKGKYLALARVELKRIDEREKAARAKAEAEQKMATERLQQEVVRAEQQAWERARAANDIAAYADYLKSYPGGRFAALAEVAMQKAEREAADKARQEPPRYARDAQASESFQRGKAAYDRHDYREALVGFGKAAEQGNAQAQASLGYMYDTGRGVARDDAEAFKWYRKSAEQGNAVAQANLGNMYAQGRGVIKDEIEAVKWLGKAAEQGNAQAQGNLGYIYETGRGVARDEAEAAKWYRRSAEQGNAVAQANLGNMYANGRGVPKNEAEAVKWLRKAAEQGNAQAQGNLGYMYETGRGVIRDDAEAVNWYRKAAEQGNAHAQSNLGTMYRRGRGVAKNEVEALRWYRKSAEQGNALAQSHLGSMYWSGSGGLDKDEAEAVRWFRKSAEQGNALGQRNLGYMYANGGGGLAKDANEAVKWYRLAAEQGEEGAAINLGLMYEKGLGVAVNRQEAIKWYRRAAERGSAKAKENLKRLGES